MNAIRNLTIASLLLATPATSALAAAAAPATPAPAAAAAAAQPPIAPPSGPPIPGVCVFSYDRTIADSSVGKAFAARLQQLNSQAEAELNPERTTLQNDARTLEGQRASLPADQFQQRAEALNQRIQAYGQKEQLRARELEQTRNVQLQRIIAQVNPLVAQVYNAQKCSVVLESQAVLAINPAMDITDEVVAQLNTRMSTITFDRERLEQAAPAAPAAAPAR